VENFKIFGGFKTVPLSDLTLQGLPVHSGPAVDAVLESKCEDLARAVSRLALLHAHDALVILRSSLSVPKLLYTFANNSTHTDDPRETFSFINAFPLRSRALMPSVSPIRSAI